MMKRQYGVWLLGFMLFFVMPLAAFSQSLSTNSQPELEPDPTLGTDAPEEPKALQAGVQVKTVWTVDSAKREAMKDVQSLLDMTIYPTMDPNRVANLKAMAQKQQVSGNRLITVFPTGDYSVTEKCSKNMFYYHPNGKLGVVEKMTSVSFGTPNCMPFYPNKSYKYSYPEGKLVAVGIKVALHELYNFKPDGTLRIHWKGERCYRADGTFCGLRKSYVTR